MKHPALLVASVLAAAVSLAWTDRSSANGSEVGFEAGTIFPLQSSTVRLLSEEVVINLSADSPGAPGRVMCRYTLENQSADSTAFSMAFITALAYSGIPWDPGGYAAAHLSASLHGERLPVRIEPVDVNRWREVIETPPDSLPTWSMTLHGGETATLRVDYQVSWSGGADGAQVGKTFTYYARPAALWAGVIEEATVTMYLGEPLALLLQCQQSSGDCVRFRASPAGYTWFSGGLRWQMRDWEPDTDFRVSLDWVSDDE